MKVLFLDVDGVLNMEKSGSHKTLNRGRLRLLSKIVSQTDCKLVISSSWRLDYSYLKRLNNFLGYRNLQIYSVTPYLESKIRGYEIDLWLERHHGEVTQYAIVDDLDQMLENQHKNFVKTDCNLGLTENDVKRIIEILNG